MKQLASFISANNVTTFKNRLVLGQPSIEFDCKLSTLTRTGKKSFVDSFDIKYSIIWFKYLNISI